MGMRIWMFLLLGTWDLDDFVGREVILYYFIGGAGDLDDFMSVCMYICVCECVLDSFYWF